MDRHHRALRQALGAATVTPETLTEARRIIKAYERIASRYPGSGYTDNALLQAAKLAADVWAATGDENDRALAVSIYKRLVAGYPMVPLFENQGLGVAIFSYDDRLFWGFNGDWDLMPDLHHFANDVETSFEELHAFATAREVRTLTGHRLSS